MCALFVCNILTERVIEENCLSIMQERGKQTTKSTSKRLVLVKLSKVPRPNVQKRVE